MKAGHGDLYIVAGHNEMSHQTTPGVMSVIEDPSLFEKLGTLWSQEEKNTLRIYRYLGNVHPWPPRPLPWPDA
mgnify:CR=1 FL=1